MLITPQSKLINLIDHNLQKGDVSERVQQMREISSYVTNGQHDSTYYRLFFDRHTDPSYESDPYVRAMTFDTIAEVLDHEIKHDIRPNPHLPYIDTINNTLKNETDEDTLEAALYCYGALLTKTDYTSKITKGLHEIESGLVALMNNKAAPNTLKNHAEESVEMFQRCSGVAVQFNNITINFGIAENLDPEEKNNMTLFTEVQEFHQRTADTAETALDTLKIKGEFQGQTMFIDVPKDALDQIDIDILNCRGTRFDDVRILKSGIVVAEGCQPS